MHTVNPIKDAGRWRCVRQRDPNKRKVCSGEQGLFNIIILVQFKIHALACLIKSKAYKTNCRAGCLRPPKKYDVIQSIS